MAEAMEEDKEEVEMEEVEMVVEETEDGNQVR